MGILEDDNGYATVCGAHLRVSRGHAEAGVWKECFKGHEPFLLTGQSEEAS